MPEALRVYLPEQGGPFKEVAAGLAVTNSLILIEAILL
jgi:hypothetical protein